jgi:hypothetical protein
LGHGKQTHGRRQKERLRSEECQIKPWSLIISASLINLLEIFAKVFLNIGLGETIGRVMQPKRENQPTFFDLAVQQRGSANPVLETIAREVDFTPAEERVAATYSHGGRPGCRVGVLVLTTRS